MATNNMTEGETFGVANSILLALGTVAAIAGLGELNKRRALTPRQQRQLRLPFPQTAPPARWDW